MQVLAIYIYETLNPGSVVAIWGGDCHGHWQNLWRESERNTSQSNPFSPPIKCSTIPINQIRLYLKPHQTLYSAIDAICLLGTLPPGRIYQLVIEKKLYLQVLTFQDQQYKCQHQQCSDEGYFKCLPREIILYILGFLDFRSLIQCCQVSTTFLKIASSLT